MYDAQPFYKEVPVLLMWLSCTDNQLVKYKLVSVLPETNREQLNAFLELYNDRDCNNRINSVLQQGYDKIKTSNESVARNLHYKSKTLKKTGKYI